MIRSKLIAAGFAGVTAVCTAAAAGPPITVEAPADVSRTIVSYADLNLASQAGRDALDARVRGAVRRLCGHQVMVPVGEMMDGRKCLRNSLEDARGQIAQAVADHGTLRFARSGGIEVALRK